MSSISNRAKSMRQYFNHEAKYLGKQKANPFHKTKNPQVSYFKCIHGKFDLNLSQIYYEKFSFLIRPQRKIFLEWYDRRCFTICILKSLMILAIWLALSDAIKSLTVPLYALNRIFFPGHETVLRNQSNPKKMSDSSCNFLQTSLIYIQDQYNIFTD